MDLRFKFWLTLVILTTSVTAGFSADDLAEYMTKAPYSHSERKRQEQQEQFSFNISKPINSAFYLAFGGTIGNTLAEKNTTTTFTSRVNQLDTQKLIGKQNRPYIGFLGMAGYRLNNILSFELYYSESAWDLKRTETDLLTADLLNESSKRTIKSKQLNFGPRLIIALPINKYFSPYFMGGLVVDYFKEKTTYSSDYFSPTSSSEKETAWHIVYAQGFGIRSQFTKNFGMRLEVYAPYFINTATKANLITYVSF